VLRRILVSERRQEEDGENYVMRSFLISLVLDIIGLSNQGR
jgi:hypothetical protein